MPICEVFGSCVPNGSWTLATGEELSCHAVIHSFAQVMAFYFNHPPIEHVMGGAATPALGSQLGPEYFLLVWNCLLASFGKSPKDRMKSKRLSKFITLFVEPLFMESFPK
jgi:hypothetical protein